MAQLLASLVAQIAPGEKTFRLLPSGRFRSSDGSGRPKDAPAWHIDADASAPIIARCAARQSRPVIDYEHQTLLSAQNGQPAPASGWISALEWRDDGLYVTVDWTDKAAAMIAAGEYRYISPVFSYDTTGRVTDIKHAGLTNNPGLDGLTDLAALSAFFNLNEKDETMGMKQLLAALGLGENASEEAALAALAALSAAHETRLAALSAATPDPAQFVPMTQYTDMQSQLAALSAQIETGERETLMTAALADGRVLPAQKDYWVAQPVAALKAYLAVAQPIAALSGMQTDGKKIPDGDGVAALSADQAKLCEQMNITPEAFLATLKAESA